MKTLTLLAVLAFPIAAVCQEPAAPKVQLAILLDTSSSMQGLLNQARAQLWKVVNEFIAAKQDGRTPQVEVALYEYGRNSLPAEKLWVRQVQPLTRDLDKISEELFKLEISASGCEEYPGAAIAAAAADLAWDKDAKTYKAMFVAGNEPFTQGPVDPAESCRKAIAAGVIVNTIHCGTEADGRAGKWDLGPNLADGKFMNIDQNAVIVAVAAPQDAEITKLNADLNKTYLWYGEGGKSAAVRQQMQDANAANAAPSANASRAATKASANYFLADVDLVDKAKEPGFEITKLKDDELPAEMKSMNEDQRRELIEKHAAERRDIQGKLAALVKARDSYVAEKQNEQAGTLDAAMRQAVREQAQKKNFIWKPDP
jgi:hypothetical protein